MLDASLPEVVTVAPCDDVVEFIGCTITTADEVVCPCSFVHAVVIVVASVTVSVVKLIVW